MKKYSKCKYHGRIYIEDEPDKIIVTDKVAHLIEWLIKNKPETYSILYLGKRINLRLHVK